MSCRPLTAAAFAIAVAAVLLLAAGCGGGSSLQVAQLTTTVSGTAPGSALPAADAYAACMRKHGVKDFPDPNSQGQFTGLSSLNATTPTFAAAARACQPLQLSGPPPSPQAQRQAVEAALKVARCMRKHGVASFPDPHITTQGGGVSATSQARTGHAVDQNSTQFRAALAACRNLLRGVG